ncbi:MAG TPA: hypothetical protein VKB43_06990 [Gaiellaceae bacterium]|nr:hypothetical protein [Gaiellaceae bacterium]
MSSGSARNSLLAAAAAIGVFAAVLQVVATSLELSEFFRFPGQATWLKVATGLEVLGWVFVLAAFAAALVGFLLSSRGSLAVSAGMFAGYGLSTLAAALIELVKSWGFSFQPWQFKADGIGETAAALSLAIAALVVLIGVLSARPDGLLGWGSLGLAGYAVLLATAYSFNLAGYLNFGPGIPREISWGLGLRAGGEFFVAVAAVAAAVAFFGSSGRRKRGEPWVARREGSLGIAAIVFAVGFLFVSVGLMLFASQITGIGREEAAYWLMAVGQLFLAFAAVCGAIGFFSSRNAANRRGRSEEGDGPDLPALPDPG